MMTAEDEQTQLLGAPKEVDIVAIERELTQLWKQASENSGDTAAAPIVRACALNLVVVTDDEKELDELAAMIGEVTLEHPARIFLIAANRRSGIPKLEAWISARCSLPVPGGKQVCCEQITVTADGAEASKVPSIVTSLLVSDVPSVLLWKPPVDAQDTMLQALAQVIDRIIIDSSEMASPEHALVQWRAFASRMQRHSTFGDLAWTHLVPWRSLIAHAFNPPEMRARLPTIDAVTIECSTTSSPKHSGISQALMLTAWLARKLEWQLIKPFQKIEVGECTAKLRCGEQAINVRVLLIPPRSGFPGGIESATIHTSDATALEWRSTDHNGCVLVNMNLLSVSSSEIHHALSDKSEAMLIAQELEVISRDTGYEAVLESLGQLLGAKA